MLGVVIFSLTSYAKNINQVKQTEIAKPSEMNIAATDANASFDDGFEKEFSDGNVTATADRFDPLEGYNRVITNFNDKVYVHVLDPMAKTYDHIVPEGGRVAVNRGFKNAQAPVSVANNILQLKLKNAAKETGRFVVNTIFGLGGLFDPAKSDLGLEAHEEDFGQTLGYYGVGEGIPIVLPFLGPSNLRDLAGMTIDGYFNPLRSSKIGNANYKIANNTFESILYKSGDMFNKASLHTGEYQMIKKDAIDLYPYLQDAYSDYQNQQIKE